MGIRASNKKLRYIDTLITALERRQCNRTEQVKQVRSMRLKVHAIHLSEQKHRIVLGVTVVIERAHEARLQTV